MNPRRVTWHHLALLAALMGLAVWLVFPRVAQPPSFDAAHFYLPMARRLLKEGFAFLGTPESLTYAPFAYIYPALLGASDPVVRWANIALFCGLIAMAFYTGRAAHSTPAGLTGAFFLAVSPTIRPYIGDALTEPLFLFLLGAWISSVAAVAQGRLKTGAAIGGIALGIAILTRPVLMYLPAVLAAWFAWRAWREFGIERKRDVSLAAMHGIALLICALVVFRNAFVFGYPGVAVGAGNALFHGVNVIVDGFDPVYYGLTYDDGAALQGKSPLSIDADRLLRAVALQQVAETPWSALIEMAARKALAFAFVTPAEPGQNIALLRSWRVVLLALAACAVAWNLRSRVVVALSFLVGYMWLIHLPLLYHHRYSVGGIDLPFAILAGIGAAAAWGATRRLSILVFAIVLGVGAGLWSLASAGPGTPRITGSPHEVIWSRADTFTQRVSVSQPFVEIPVLGAPKLHPWDHYVLLLQLSVMPQRGATCSAIKFNYKGSGEGHYVVERSVRIPIIADGERHEIAVGATNPLSVNREGTLKLELQCSSSADLKVEGMRLAAPRRAQFYRSLVKP